MLQTKNAAFNALLSAKDAACKEKGIVLETDIRTGLTELPLPSWELCTVMGNLLNNAMDALNGQPDGRIRLTAYETLDAFILQTANNGPAIPPELRERIFEAEVSTKGPGRGMGLHNAREALAEYGASLTLEEGPEVTFTVTVPRAGRSDA